MKGYNFDQISMFLIKSFVAEMFKPSEIYRRIWDVYCNNSGEYRIDA